MRHPTLPLLSVLSLLAASCTPSVGKIDATEPVDQDQDGFGPDVDCDDDAPEVSPRASERCDGVDNDCDGLIDNQPVDGLPAYADGDGDGFGNLRYADLRCELGNGFVDNSSDCDDLRADVSPDAPELCDGVDNDCDGTADEAEAIDAPLWYADRDGDGYGNPEVAEAACTQPRKSSALGDDCDDADATRSPGLVELCDADGIDEDCDGLANDADSAVFDPAYWYWDGDADGHGDAALPTTACEAPDGYVGPDDDCDDADPWVYPGAAERCGDGRDEDCDGVIDVGGEEIAWYADADADGFGDPGVASGLSCAALAGASSSADDCDDADAEVNPGAEERWYDGVDQDCDAWSDYDADGDGVLAAEWGEDCDDEDPESAPDLPERCGTGADEDCDGVIDPCDLVYEVHANDAGDHGGASLALIADLDGDGLGELALGAPRSDEHDDDAGYVFVLRSGDEGSESFARSTWQLQGVEPGDRAGEALAGGDLDGDGVRDLVVGAPGSGLGLDGAGAIYTLFEVAVGTHGLDEGDGAWTGQGAGDEAGAALASAGDLDGDGYGELLVGAPGAGAGAGAAFLVHGPVSGSADLSWAETVFVGETAGAAVGSALVAGADLDGDGLGDLVIGGPLATIDEAVVGAAWLLLDPQPGLLSVEDADAAWWGGSDGRTGAAVASVGDIDGDGLEDLAIAAPDAGVGGEVWLLSGGLASSGLLEIGLASAHFQTERAGAALGSAILGLGDLDGDGAGELLLSAPGEDHAGSDSGAVWLLSGPLVGEIGVEVGARARIDGGESGQRAGSALATLPDWDGDGVVDVAVGAPASDVSVDVDATVWLWSFGGF